METDGHLWTEKIDKGIRVLFYIVIFWLPYAPAVIETGVILALVAWLIKRHVLFSLRQKSDPSAFGYPAVRRYLGSFLPISTPINKPIYFFLGGCLVSVIFGVTPLYSLRGFLTKTFEWFLVYFLIVESFQTKKQIYTALGVFLFTSAAVMLDGFVQYYFTQKDFFRGREIAQGLRVTAPFRTPNGYGGYLTIFMPFLLSACFIGGKRKILNSLFGILTVFSFWSLVITFSRGAWLGLFFGVIFMGFFFAKYKKRLRVFFVILLILCLLFGGVIGYLYSKGSMDANKYRLNTATWRLRVWQDAFKMIGKRPVFGYGINTFMREFQPFYHKKDNHFEFNPTYAHNCYIQVWAETGILGLGLFLWLLFSILRNSVQNIQKFYSTDYKLMLLLLGLSAGVVAFLVQSFFDTNLYSLQLSVYIWLIVGLLFSLIRVSNKPEKNL